ncbi:unnamed protein product [Notodromas monacha]|uniref:Uncharacterized protein n=1 Tax=Notodromas monacha TaxID=399045 RepID=A0A7R9GB12_9CRUS|nr:unnamed protein product [Notodromas monacha]CAG0916035.1 unnamed protein product [Notodromas monacha]
MDDASGASAEVSMVAAADALVISREHPVTIQVPSCFQNRRRHRQRLLAPQLQIKAEHVDDDDDEHASADVKPFRWRFSSSSSSSDSLTAFVPLFSEPKIEHWLIVSAMLNDEDEMPCICVLH